MPTVFSCTSTTSINNQGVTQMSHEVVDALLEERVRHFEKFANDLTQASHEAPHLDPVIDVLHHSFRTALKQVRSRLGLLSMDLHAQVVDDTAFIFNLRDKRKMIRCQQTGQAEFAALHSHDHRPILRLYARKASLWSRVRRLRRRASGKRPISTVSILAYLVHIEQNAAAAPLACPSQCTISGTIFQELLTHGFIPESVSAQQSHLGQSEAEQEVGHRTWAGPDTYQVMLVNRDIEVFFNIRVKGLYEFGEMPEMNHYVEERQLAVG